MSRLRAKLTYANIMATLCLVLVLSGGTAVAVTGGNFLLGKSNSASSKTSLSVSIANKALQVTNSSTEAGAAALGLTTASGHPPLIVNSGTKVKNLNADELDGQDASALDEVRQFSATTAFNSDVVEMISDGGLTLSRSTTFDDGIHTVFCDLELSSGNGGRYDAATTTTFTSPPSYKGGNFTPITNDVLAHVPSDQSEVGEIVFINLDTGRVVSVQFSVVAYDSNAGCRWQGTAYTA
jgi:hypothetical protein